MAFRRGFKTEANALVTEIRGELELGPLDALNPFLLAQRLEVPVVAVSDFVDEAPKVRHLLDVEADAFSAVTVFAGPRRMIVHNDAHALPRQHSNVSHELAHALLHHPPTPPLDAVGCRDWDQDIEDEANWLAGALLVPDASAIAIAKKRWTIDEAALCFGVSTRMIRFRLNTTGAVQRVARARSLYSV